MSVALIEPFDEWFLSLSKGSGTTRRNDCYTKCGGFDKLNHRNANFWDSCRYVPGSATLIPALRSGTPPATCTSLMAKKSTERTEIHRLAHIFFCVNPCPICSYSPTRIHLQINSLFAPLESKITYIFSSMHYKSFLILQKNL